MAEEVKDRNVENQEQDDKVNKQNQDQPKEDV